MGRFLTAVQYVWAFPWTVIGLTIGLIGIATGGKAKRHGLVMEFHSGGVRWLLERFPNNVMAMTIGFTVIGLTAAALEVSREHERVHVAQYGRWGPFFVPAYLIASLVAWSQGKTAYMDNAFEIEAYTKAPINRPYDEDQLT